MATALIYVRVVVTLRAILMNVNLPILMSSELGIQQMNIFSVFEDLQPAVQPKAYCCDLNTKMVKPEVLQSRKHNTSWQYRRTLLCRLDKK